MERESESNRLDDARIRARPAEHDLDNPLTSARRPLADSPWFWAYLFGTGALISLFLAQPRYLQRQSQLERQFAARQSGGQVIMGRDGPIPPSNAERLVVPLRPLYIAAALIMAVAWGGLCWQRFTRSDRAAPRSKTQPGPIDTSTDTNGCA